MPWIDSGNVDQFVGKTVDATHRRWHYYPLTILHRADIGYCYRDRTGTVVRNDFAREPVAYDVILEEALKDGSTAD